MTVAWVLAGALLAAAPALPARVLVVQDTAGAASAQAVAGLARAGAAVETLSVSDPTLGARLAKEPPDGVALALGPKSAARLAAAPGGLRACALVRAEQMPTSLPGVSLEAPPEDVLAQIATAFPGRTRVLVLRASRAEADALGAAARARGLRAEVLVVTEPGEAVPAVEAALSSEHADAVLWLRPDPAAVTVDTVGPLIEAALAYRVPVVGGSSYFLKAGALAAESLDAGASAVAAVQLAQAGSKEHRAPAGKLVVDGRRAERLGVLVRAGPGVEVQR